jgi:Undecaprenyl-phosphate galactose phosphotransferase WbaP
MPQQPSDTLNAESQQHKLPHRAFIASTGLFLLGLFLILVPKPAQYHPHVIFETGPVQIELLLHGQLDEDRCKKTVDAITSTMLANCPDCKTVKKICLKTLNNEQVNYLSASPLETYSARTMAGVIVYHGTADVAKILCEAEIKKSREMSTSLHWTCHRAGEPRPLSVAEQDWARSGQQIFTAIIYAMGIGLVALLVFLFLNYQNYRAWTLKTEGAPDNNKLSPRPTYLLLHKFTLAGVDALILTSILMAFSWPASYNLQRWSQIDQKMVVGQIFVIMLTIGWFWVLMEHYARRRPFWDEIREIVRVITVMLIVSAAIAFVAGLELGRLNLLMAGIFNLVLIPVGRVAVRGILDDLGLWKISAVIIGTGKNAHDAYLALKAESSMGYEILGFINTLNDKPPESLRVKNQSVAVFPLSAVKNIPDSMHIVLALDNLTEAHEQNLARSILSISRNKIHIIPSLRGLPLHGTQVTHFFSHEVLLLTIRNNLARRSYKIIKRTFDVICGLILLVVLSPLFLFLVHAIRKDGAPAFYGHTRIGRDGEPFKCMKFRSMRADADKVLKDLLASDPQARAEWALDFKLRNDPRITTIGQWLRKTSLDELPQLFNVIRGEMSLVGPRPIVSEELDRYGEYTDLYLQIRPGMTGLWQVSGRNDTGYEERVALDAWYVQNWSLWYDVAILFKTIDVVINRRGAY